MMICSIGDSFIYGSELGDVTDDHASNKTWPAILAQRSSLDYKCYAWPGIGNQQILNRLLSAIQIHKSAAFYVINWTWIDRYDYVDKEYEIADFPMRWRTVRPSLDNKTKDQFYYKHFHSQEHDILSSCTFVFAAVNALLKYDCKFAMTYMDDLMLNKLQNRAPLDFLQQEIVDHLQSFDGKNFLDWAINNKYPIGKQMHPLELAHEKAAEYWIPKVRTLLNTFAKED